MKHLSKKLRRPLAVAAVAVTLVGAAAAANAKRTMDVTYRDIKMVVDGVEVVPRDAAGTPIALY